MRRYANENNGNGAANRTRTCDPVITNDVLYQLSYCGDAGAGKQETFRRRVLIG